MYTCMELCDPAPFMDCVSILTVLFFTDHNRSCGKAMFSEVFVCPQKGRVMKGGSMKGGATKGVFVEGGCHEGTPLLINKRLVRILLEWFLVLLVSTHVVCERLSAMQGLPECDMAKFLLILSRIPIHNLTTQKYPPPPPPPSPPRPGNWNLGRSWRFEFWLPKNNPPPPPGCSWSVWRLIAVSAKDTVSDTVSFSLCCSAVSLCLCCPIYLGVCLSVCTLSMLPSLSLWRPSLVTHSHSQLKEHKKKEQVKKTKHSLHSQ